MHPTLRHSSRIEHIPTIAEDPAECGQLSVQHSPFEVIPRAEIIEAVFFSTRRADFLAPPRCRADKCAQNHACLPGFLFRRALFRRSQFFRVEPDAGCTTLYRTVHRWGRRSRPCGAALGPIPAGSLNPKQAQARHDEGLRPSLCNTGSDP